MWPCHRHNKNFHEAVRPRLYIGFLCTEKVQLSRTQAQHLLLKCPLVIKAKERKSWSLYPQNSSNSLMSHFVHTKLCLPLPNSYIFCLLQFNWFPGDPVSHISPLKGQQLQAVSLHKTISDPGCCHCIQSSQLFAFRDIPGVSGQ